MSGKKKTLTEKLKEAEKRAFDAEFDLKLERGKTERFGTALSGLHAQLNNERDRSRTLQFMADSHPTISDYSWAVHEIHTLKCIIGNLFKAPSFAKFAACPSCGVIAFVKDDSTGQQSGYRLCPKCLSSMKDPWLRKPDEYALATKGDDR